MHLTRSMLVAAATLLAACAGGAGPAAGPSPSTDLAALEAASQQRPRDAGLMTQLGIANYEAKQYGRARDVLLSALTLNRQNYAAHVYLGLSYEGLAQFDSARAEYTTAALQAKGNDQRNEIQNRLVLLTRTELRAAARQAVAQEAVLSTQPPTQNAVAVFPFRFVGSNAELEPLGRGLTQLMITDLSKLPRLTLLERERVQALVDELSLTESGRVDPATGARSGRMLRAARVVQGSVQEVTGAANNLRLDAAVVDASSSAVVATGAGTDRLAQLFDLEKQVLFRLLDQMGVVVTPAERRAISERPTADLQAFLAFSRGLEAEDRGDYAAAEAAYSAALARDPNFRQARERQQNTVRMSQAEQTTPRTLAGLPPTTPLGERPAETPTSLGTTAVSRAPILRTGIEVTVPSTGTTLTNRAGGPTSRPPTTRPSAPETFFTDIPGVPTLSGTIVIIITRP